MFAPRIADLRHEDLAGLRWAGYVRESTRGQADRYGPGMQRTDHRRYAERYGLVSTDLEYLDLVSGKDAAPRMQFQTMLRDAEARRFDVLLCYDTSRFARNPADHYLYLQRLAALGISVVFCAENLIAGNTDTYEIQGMKAVTDAAYLQRLSRNVSLGLRQKWERFSDPGGQPPLGFARVGDYKLLAPVEGPELETVRRAFGLYASGVESDASIGAKLGLSEFRIEEILQNPLYAGRVIRHKGRPDEEARPARFEAPIDPALFADVQHLRVQRRTRHHAGGGEAGRRPYPLVGLLACVDCGSHYHGDAANKTRRLRHVRRPACAESLTCRADIVEEQVAAVLDELRLSDADIETVLGLIELTVPVEVPPQRDTTVEREELQRRLAAGELDINAFSRAWRRLEEPIPLSRKQATAEQLQRARPAHRLRRPVARRGGTGRSQGTGGSGDLRQDRVERPRCGSDPPTGRARVAARNGGQEGPPTWEWSGREDSTRRIPNAASSCRKPW